MLPHTLAQCCAQSFIKPQGLSGVFVAEATTPPLFGGVVFPTSLLKCTTYFFMVCARSASACTNIPTARCFARVLPSMWMWNTALAVVAVAVVAQHARCFLCVARDSPPSATSPRAGCTVRAACKRRHRHRRGRRFESTNFQQLFKFLRGCWRAATTVSRVGAARLRLLHVGMCVKQSHLCNVGFMLGVSFLRIVG